MTTTFPQGGLRPGSGPDDEIVELEPAMWRQAVQQSRDDGFTWFDSLHAIDEILRPRAPGGADELRVVCRLMRATGVGGRQLHVRVPREPSGCVLDSIVDLVPGAAWHEREAHDFFGVRFDGGDDRALLWHPNEGQPAHPLRKDELLGARLETPWPGGKEPGEDAHAQASRRRTLPPGVPDPDVLADPSSTASDIVASLSGGRVRRRR